MLSSWSGIKLCCISLVHMCVCRNSLLLNRWIAKRDIVKLLDEYFFSVSWKLLWIKKDILSAIWIFSFQLSNQKYRQNDRNTKIWLQIRSRLSSINALKELDWLHHFNWTVWLLSLHICSLTSYIVLMDRPVRNVYLKNTLSQFHCSTSVY